MTLGEKVQGKGKLVSAHIMQAYGDRWYRYTPALHGGKWSTLSPGHFVLTEERWYPMNKKKGGPHS